MLYQIWELNPIPHVYQLFLTSQLLPIRLLSCLSLACVTSLPSLSPTQHHTVALRQLTGKGRSFLWLPEHQVEFDKLKTILTSNLVVQHFNHTKPVYLLTDASRLFGIGYAIGHMEIDTSGKEIFKIVHCGSKGFTPTQQRFSTIELECLAIVWATLKCSFYLRGLPLFTIYTDHRPLQGVFLGSSGLSTWKYQFLYDH